MPVLRTPAVDHRNCRGFTLVEMILVLVIMGVFAGMAAVSFQGRRSAQGLRVAADDVAAAIRYASTEARVRSVPHRVSFDARSASYKVEVWSSDEDAFGPVRGLPGRSRALPEGIRPPRIKASTRASADTEEEVQFGPDRHFAGTVEFVDRANRRLEIRVAPMTSQVTVGP